jgi:hypothetical protein
MKKSFSFSNCHIKELDSGSLVLVVYDHGQAVRNVCFWDADDGWCASEKARQRPKNFCHLVAPVLLFPPYVYSSD